MSPAIAQPLDRILGPIQPGIAGPMTPRTPRVPPPGGIQATTTMVPGAPGYEEHMARQRQTQEMRRQMDEGTWTPPPPITTPMPDPILPGTPQVPQTMSPWLNPFMEVYETTKTGAMKNLEEMQKSMAERFAHRGGYFGGEHAISQAELGERTGTALDQLLSQTSLGASERAYQDWLRARQETMMPFNMISPLLGAQTSQPLITQSQGLGGPALGAAGTVLGSLVGKSSERFKKDIHLLDENDESKIFEEMADVPIFKYKYRADPEGKERIGLISERAPKEITFLEDTFVGLYEYIGMLHATVKELSRKVQKLEGIGDKDV